MNLLMFDKCGLDRVLIYLTIRGATSTYFLLINTRSALVRVSACFGAVNSSANNGSTGVSVYARRVCFPLSRVSVGNTVP